MTNTNKEVNVNEVTTQYDLTTGEIVSEVIVQDTPEYTVVKTLDGKFKKKMKFQKYHSRIALNEDEQMELYQVFNGNNPELVIPMKNLYGKEIVMAHLFITPYDKFDEETGLNDNRVLTTIQDDKGKYFATSSKTVYYTIKNIIETFGKPSDENYKPLKLKVVGVKGGVNGVQTTIQLVGRA